MFETKTIVLILVILLLILFVYKMSIKSENLDSSINTFVQDFIKSKLDNSGNFMITDLSNNNIINFKVIKDLTSLNNINLLNEGILINDGDNNIILIGKIKMYDEFYLFIFSITDIMIDKEGELNLVGVTPVLKYINDNQIQFNDGILTIIIDNDGNFINFQSNTNDKHTKSSKLIGYTDKQEMYGFGIKLQDGSKKIIANHLEISNKLKNYYPVHTEIIKTVVFISFVNNLQDFLKTYKK